MNQPAATDHYWGPGRYTPLWLFLDRFRSPLVLILIFVASIVHDWIDASIVLAIVFVSAAPQKSQRLLLKLESAVDLNRPNQIPRCRIQIMTPSQ